MPESHKLCGRGMRHSYTHGELANEAVSGCGAGLGLEVTNRQLHRQQQHTPLQRLKFAPSPISWRDMSSLLLTGGRVIDPANSFDSVADVLISDGKIAAVGTDAA